MLIRFSQKSKPVEITTDEFDEMVKEGKLGGYYPMKWSEGNARWADLHGQVPDQVLDKLEEIEKEIMAGSIDIFTQADLFAQQ